MTSRLFCFIFGILFVYFYKGSSLTSKWIPRLTPHFVVQDASDYAVRIKETLTCENRTQYSGYIDLLDSDDHFFFIFYPSQNSASRKSTILWLNGGPGCSSELGAWAGIGPCRITDNGDNVFPNPHTWNENANLLFLDQPIGTGFSYGNTRQSRSSDAAKQVYTFLQAFFGAMSDYVPNSFTIAGESYAGKYLPALSDEIMARNEQLKTKQGHGIHLPLKAIIIGNGWIEPKTQLANYVTFGCEKDGRNDDFRPIFDRMTCEKMQSTSSRCQSLMEKCYKSDSYWTCIPAGVYCLHTQINPYDTTGRSTMDIRRKCANDDYCYSIERGLETYANTVRVSLGADDKAPPFENCRSSIERRFYIGLDQTRDYSHSIARALNQDIGVLLYAGDMDWICNWRGIYGLAQSLKWKGQQGFNMTLDKDVYTDGSEKPTGQVRSFGKLTFLRVFDAGHMASFDQPLMCKTFIIDQWLNEFI